MNKIETIEIYKVANGYLVTTCMHARQDGYRDQIQTHCFKKMADLAKYLKGYFKIKK